MGEHSGADCGQEMPELWGQAIRYALNRLSLDEIGQRYGGCRARILRSLRQS